MSLSKEFVYLVFVCDCCGKKTTVTGKLDTPISSYYLAAYNRGFHVYYDNVTLCPHCYKVIEKISDFSDYFKDFSKKV